MKHRSFDFLGNIAVVKFSDGIKRSEKKKFAEKILKEQKPVKTVLEKAGDFKGRLRTMKTRFLAGEKTKEVKYKENNCVFRFNIDETYFSPRLSSERKEIAGKIKKDDVVLVMFAGVAPFPIVIAKNSKAKKIYSNEINRKANKYAELNIELNKVKNKIVLLPGDIKNVSRNLKKSALARDKLKYADVPSKFEVIIMPRPKLKDTFLKQAFELSKKGTKIYYYDFCKTDEQKEIIDKIKKQSKKFKKKIKILKVKPAGEIAPYKIRLRVDFKVL